jgi:prepilin-type N-terminal cleavage/methylation domain-containing protein
MLFAKFAARINKKGFTLIELIVVIAILAVLAVTAMLAIGNVSSQAQFAAARADANTIVRALNTYNSLCNSEKVIDGSNDHGARQDLELNASAADDPDIVTLDLSIAMDATRFGTAISEEWVTYGDNGWIVVDSALPGYEGPTT